MKMKHNNLPVKKNLSSTQVLKTLQILMEDNYTMAELIQRLNENEKESIFNNSVVSKYINTCRYCGIKIPKINNKYYVSSIPFGMNISESENDLINYLQSYSKKAMSLNANKAFSKFIAKLSKYSNRELSRIEEDSLDITCAIFEKAVKSENRVLLMLKNKMVLDCVPINVLEYDGKLYFHVLYEGKEKNIQIDRISGLEVLKDRFKPVKTEGTVIFKLTGDLAKNYNLRENEKIITNNLPGSLTVINYNENAPILLSRLMRYGELCEIESPKYFRTDMKNTVDNTLSNYGE